MTEKMTISLWGLKGTAEGNHAVTTMAATSRFGMIILVILLFLFASDIKANIKSAGSMALAYVVKPAEKDTGDSSGLEELKLVSTLRPAPIPK